MARLPRICLPDIPQHVIQRGNNRQACFGSDEDCAAYAHWLEAYAWKNVCFSFLFMAHLRLTALREVSTFSG